MGKWMTKKTIAATLLILLGIGVATGESNAVKNVFNQVIEYVQSYLDTPEATE